MNTFADSLFSVLFGWVRSLVQGIWSSVVNGNFSSFFSWLGDHWLWLVLILGLICTAIDFLIWMIRWRPYLVWRTNLRRLIRRMRGEKDDPRTFEAGYTDGVALDLQDPPAPEWQEAPEALENNFSQIPPVLPEEFYAPQPPVAEESLVPENAYAAQQSYFSAQQEPYTPVNPPKAAPRKRRSEKHERKRVSWHERLVADEADQDALLDGLPPAVGREQAFHEPVYPQSSANYAAWKKPENNNQMNG